MTANDGLWIILMVLAVVGIVWLVARRRRAA
jgi:LPXTG-motif cell wall-anchored protein